MSLLPFFMQGQGSNLDVVYLKNGSVIRGVIIEQIPNQTIKIQTNDNVFVFRFEEIERITKEQSTLAQKKVRSFRANNIFMGAYVGIDIASLRPDANKFCDELATSMDVQDGFSEFSFLPKSRIGFTGGITLYGRLSGSLFLQTELSYTMKGLVINGEGTYTYGWDTYHVFVDEYLKLNYLNIPLYFKYYFFDKGIGSQKKEIFNLYLQAGPSIGITLAKKMMTVVTLGGNTDNQDQTFEGFQGVDFSVDFGLGIELAKILDLEFRYYLGVKNVLKDNSADNIVLKNSVFTFGLGFTWPL